MYRFLSWAAFLSLMIAGCSTSQVEQSFYGACASYSSLLVVASNARAAGVLTPGTIRAINGANDVVIGDPSHGMPGLCTSPTPPADLAAATNEILSRVAVIRQGL